MINAFCEFMASSSVIYKNEKGEEVISFERVWSLRDVRYEISKRLKNHTFPELNFFGYCCDPEKPGLLNNIHTCLWQSQFLTKGHLKVRSIESRDTEHETEINPKIIIVWAWHIIDEVVDNLKALNFQGEIWSPLPEFKIYPTKTKIF
jgi:hypothetical protein